MKRRNNEARYEEREGPELNPQLRHELSRDTPGHYIPPLPHPLLNKLCTSPTSARGPLLPGASYKKHPKVKAAKAHLLNLVQTLERHSALQLPRKSWVKHARFLSALLREKICSTCRCLKCLEETTRRLSLTISSFTVRSRIVVPWQPFKLVKHNVAVTTDSTPINSLNTKTQQCGLTIRRWV